MASFNITITWVTKVSYKIITVTHSSYEHPSLCIHRKVRCVRFTTINVTCIVSLCFHLFSFLKSCLTRCLSLNSQNSPALEPWNKSVSFQYDRFDFWFKNISHLPSEFHNKDFKHYFRGFEYLGIIYMKTNTPWLKVWIMVILCGIHHTMIAECLLDLTKPYKSYKGHGSLFSTVFFYL